jgi:alanine racemase
MAEYSINNLSELIGGKILQKGKTSNLIKYLLIDSRKVNNAKQACFFALTSATRNGHDHIEEAYNKGVRCFVVAQNLPLQRMQGATVICVDDTLIALQGACKKHRDQFDLPVIAITGSNGKTVVKEWLFQLLKKDISVVKSPKSYNSQLGVPLSLWLCEKQHQLGVFEAGVSQPSEMDTLENLISPTIGIITNIGTAHGENFISQSEKAAEKFLLFKNCEHLIYCKDDSYINNQTTSLSKKVKLFSWSKTGAADLQITNVSKGRAGNSITARYLDKVYTITIPFADAASIENVIHCWALLLVLGYDAEFIKERLLSLTPVAMRLELKAGINNCLLINDFYNCDLVSLGIAVDFIEHQHKYAKKTLILSDVLESGKPSLVLYKEVNQLILNKGINKVIGIGHEISANAGCFDLEKCFYPDTSAFLDSHDLNSFKEETVLLKGARSFEFERISEYLQMEIHSTVLEVNLSAVQHNLNFFKSKLNPKVKLMAMVKAYSYGAGSFEVANLLQFNKIDYLGVAYPEEGVALRKAGIYTPIMVMNADVHSFEKMIKYQLEPEIFNFETLGRFKEILERQLLSKPYPIHIKIDTGMHRLGFSIDDVNELIQVMKGEQELEIRSVFSHLATSDDARMRKFTQQQVDKFIQVKSKFIGAFNEDPLFHLVNSSGILEVPDAQFDMARLGLGLYGISPIAKFSNHLQKVSSLITSISQVKTLTKGDSVGYSRVCILEKSTAVAVIPIGYADGMRRSLGNKKGHVMVGGKKAPILGNVCMDMTMIDVTGLNVKEGDQVIVFGKGLSIEEFAKNMDTIPYEALTGISPRVKRVYFQE